MAATPRAVDLTDVKEGGNFRPRRKPEGDYKAKVVKADDHQPNDKTKPLGWVLTIQVDGDARSTYPYYLSPEAKQAWKVRGIMVAAGFSAKAARIKFDPNKLVNKKIGVALEDDEYEGRQKSVIADVFPESEVGGNADEDVPDYDDADDTVDVPEDDEEEVEVEEEAPAPARRRVAKKRAPEPEPEDDEDDDDEEEEAPAPPPRKRRAAAPPVKAATRRAKAAPVEEDDDDLDDLETDDLD